MALLTLFVTIMLAVSPVLSSITGEPCRNDNDCEYDHQECIKRFDECDTKACFCKPDYGGRFVRRCGKDLGFTDRCDDRYWVQCPEESTCDDDQDRCIPYIRAGSSCTSGGTPCVSYASCTVSTGTSRICTCDSPRKMENGRCVYAEFGDACSSTNCDNDYTCRGSPLTCQCLNATYTHLTYREGGEDVTRCVHAQATTGVEVGGACRPGVTSNFGKICGSGLTCSQCLDEDAPTCITPTGGADGVKAGFFILSAALLLTTLM